MPLLESDLCDPSCYFAMDDLTLNVATVPEPPAAILGVIVISVVGLTGTLGRRFQRTRR